MTPRLLCFGFFFATLFASLPAQTTSSGSPNPDEQLRYVVYLSRHGVRSPTGKPAQYNTYSVASWPDWDVPPGYLIPHGYHLMELFGAYDRVQLAGEGLILPQGCSGANLTSIGGLLDLDRIADRRRNDTPPGGALVFELWKNLKSGEFSVRTHFTVQTLEQMRIH